MIQQLDAETKSSISEDNGNWSEVPSRNKHHRHRNRKQIKNNNNNEQPEQPPPPEYSYISPTSDFHERHNNKNNKNVQPYILLLVGIPGSGKTSLSKSLMKARPYKYTQINQDKLGNRQNCIDKTRELLHQNKNNNNNEVINKIPIIDRCNVDKKQRKYFIDIANDFNIPIDCVVFMYPVDVCVKRCLSRIGHETIGKNDDAEKIVNNMAKLFIPPWIDKKKEGFRNIKVVNNVDMVNDIILEYINE